MTQPPATLPELGSRVLARANLHPAIEARCRLALSRPHRLLSSDPVWARLFLGWTEALSPLPRATFLPGAVACEFMAAGYDMIDAADDRETDLPNAADRDERLAAVTLLLQAQQVMAQVATVPAADRARACALLARLGIRALGAHRHDVALRYAPRATLGEALTI